MSAMKLLLDPSSRKQMPNFLSFLAGFVLVMFLCIYALVATWWCFIPNFKDTESIHSVYLIYYKFLTSTIPNARAGCLWKPASAFVS